MNTNNLKTFQLLPYGAKENATGAYPEVTPTLPGEPSFPGSPSFNTPVTFGPINTFGGKSGLLDGDLVKSVEVVDTDTGYPLENVNVFVKGTNRGTITGANGIATVVAQNQNEVIVFSWQSKKREFVFKNLGSLVNIDTKLTQAPVQVVGTPRPATPMATDSKVNWMKWAGLGIAGLVLINMFGENSPKKVKV